MALGQARRNKNTFVPPKLQITAMMDMFTIIVIFLIFSFSNNQDPVKLDESISLPESVVKNEFEDTVKLILTKKDLKLDDTVVATISGDKIENFDPANPEQSQLYQRLKAFKENREKENKESIVENEQKAQEAQKEQSEPNVLFFCDRDHSFETINNVIKTAGMAGYPNFQFAVLMK